MRLLCTWCRLAGTTNACQLQAWLHTCRLQQQQQHPALIYRRLQPGPRGGPGLTDSGSVGQEEAPVRQVDQVGHLQPWSSLLSNWQTAAEATTPTASRRWSVQPGPSGDWTSGCRSASTAQGAAAGEERAGGGGRTILRKLAFSITMLWSAPGVASKKMVWSVAAVVGPAHSSEGPPAMTNCARTVSSVQPREQVRPASCVAASAADAACTGCPACRGCLAGKAGLSSTPGPEHACQAAHLGLVVWALQGKHGQGAKRGVCDAIPAHTARIGPSAPRASASSSSRRRTAGWAAGRRRSPPPPHRRSGTGPASASPRR